MPIPPSGVHSAYSLYPVDVFFVGECCVHLSGSIILRYHTVVTAGHTWHSAVTFLFFWFRFYCDFLVTFCTFSNKYEVWAQLSDVIENHF